MLREAAVIGVDKYRDARYSNLQKARSDAARVAGFLASGLPKGQRFRATLFQDPKATEITEYLEDVLTRLDEDSIFVFYFAGHGLYHRSSGRQLLLCEDALGVLADGDEGSGALSLGYMRSFSRRGKGNMFFCYDVCRTEIESGRGESDVGGARGFKDATSERPNASQGGGGLRWSLISCGDGQRARDDGSFVDALLGEMQDALDLRGEILLGDELVAGVARRLNELGCRQLPEPKGNPFALASSGKRKHDGADKKLEELEALRRKEVEEWRRKYEELEKRLQEARAKPEKKSEDASPKPAPQPRVAPTPAPKPKVAPPPKPQSPIFQLNLRPAGTRKVLTIKGVEVPFRWCPPGRFMMGSPKSEEQRSSNETQHEVILTLGFWLAETETTQLLWQAVMGSNPSWFSNSNDEWEEKEEELRPEWLECRFFPVESVSWNDCQEFIEKLNGLNVSGVGKFRLPTEAEWEYACRAGTTTAFPWGNVLNGDKANCDGNYPYGTSKKGKYLGKTSRVGSYPANAWGLFDMNGNVMEWCQDWYRDYPRGMQIDPQNSSGIDRIVRGGSWSHDPGICRSAFRHSLVPTYRHGSFGFRLAMTDESAASEFSSK